jgi:hypothetical protein
MSGTKKCPQCAEMVQMDAKICRFCNYSFTQMRAATPAKNSFQSCMTVIGWALVILILFLIAAWNAGAPDESAPAEVGNTL